MPWSMEEYMERKSLLVVLLLVLVAICLAGCKKEENKDVPEAQDTMALSKSPLRSRNSSVLFGSSGMVKIKRRILSCLEQKRYASPPGDNAHHWLGQGRQLDSGDPELDQLKKQLATTLASDAESAWEEKDWGGIKSFYKQILYLHPDDKLAQTRYQEAAAKLPDDGSEPRPVDPIRALGGKKR